MGVQINHWRFERCLWALFCLIVMMALAGLFSAGWLSDVRAVSEDQKLSVQYQRFTLNGAASDMTITVRANQDGEAVVWLDGAFYSAFTVESISPSPIESRSRGQGVELRFASGPLSDATIYLAIRPIGLGITRSQLSMPGTSALPLVQFTYP